MGGCFAICAVIKIMSVAHILKHVQYRVSLHFFLAFYCSYFMDGRINKVEDFLKTRLLDTLTEQITKVTKVLKFCSRCVAH